MDDRLKELEKVAVERPLLVRPVGVDDGLKMAAGQMPQSDMAVHLAVTALHERMVVLVGT